MNNLFENYENVYSDLYNEWISKYIDTFKNEQQKLDINKINKETMKSWKNVFSCYYRHFFKLIHFKRVPDNCQDIVSQLHVDCIKFYLQLNKFIKKLNSNIKKLKINNKDTILIEKFKPSVERMRFNILKTIKILINNDEINSILKCQILRNHSYLISEVDKDLFRSLKHLIN